MGGGVLRGVGLDVRRDVVGSLPGGVCAAGIPIVTFYAIIGSLTFVAEKLIRNFSGHLSRPIRNLYYTRVWLLRICCQLGAK